MARTSRRARRNSAFHLPSAFDLWAPSKELILKNIWIFGPLYAVSLVFWIHSWIWSPLPHQTVHWWQHSSPSGWVGGPVPTYLTFTAVGFSLLWLVIIAAIGTIAQIMSQAAQLAAAEGRKFDFEHLWAAVKEIGWRMLGLYIVMAVLIFIGFVLLIVPGVILIRRFFLAPYVMLDKKVGIQEALKQSADLSRLNTVAIWGVIGVMFLIGLINIIPIIGGLVSFAVGSLYSIAPALRYQQLKKLSVQ